MPRIKFEFHNVHNESLAGLLETPEDSKPIAYYAIFAHCFTCGKDIAAASRISRALAARGIAVLRFDFTGLGNSDGDFANTNFSSNVDDLISAAGEMERRFQTPSLLIGHSLGGAAVLSAVAMLPSIKAVATIGAPASANHVQHLFDGSVKEIDQIGEAPIKIGSREFKIKKQMIDDLNQHNSLDHIGNLRVALAVFHSPIDNIVPVDEAAKIYQAAKHPKSFISLDDADHLLSKAVDSEYVAATLSTWASRYLELDSAPFERHFGTAPDAEKGEVIITEQDKKFLRGMYTANHQLVADEPASLGGTDLGPTPYDLLLMSLGACTSMTLRMYANLKKIPLEDVDIRLSHKRIHAEDCAECDENSGQGGKIERLSRIITLKGDLTEEQRQRLLEIADKCPVHKTLESHPNITTELESVS